MRRFSSTLLAGLLLTIAAACGGGENAAQGTATPDTAGRPPKNASEIIPLYKDELAELGLLLTPRNGLIDRSNNQYLNSAEGQHLAIYVEPTRARTNEEYAEGILSVTKIFVPDVFERWPRLESMDVCQEPDPVIDDREEPPPLTQIEFTREQAAAIDWDEVTVADLVAMSREDPPKLRLHIDEKIEESPEFERLTS
jgi:hypothetical protein